MLIGSLSSLGMSAGGGGGSSSRARGYDDLAAGGHPHVWVVGGTPVGFDVSQSVALHTVGEGAVWRSVSWIGMPLTVAC